jgi:hypothetical protein
MTSQKDVRDLLQLAKKAGWAYLGFDGNSHHRIRWPKTGRIVSVPSTPGGGRRSLENTEARIARESGPIRPKPGAGRSKAERVADRKRRQSLRVRVKPVDTQPEPPGWRDQLAAVKSSLEQHQEAA